MLKCKCDGTGKDYFFVIRPLLFCHIIRPRELTSHPATVFVFYFSDSFVEKHVTGHPMLKRGGMSV